MPQSFDNEAITQIQPQDADLLQQLHHCREMLAATHHKLAQREEMYQIECRRLNQELDSAMERSRLLHQVIRAIRKSLDLDTVFDTVGIEICHLLRLCWVHIVQYSSDDQIWQVIREYRSHTEIPSRLGMKIPDAHNPLAAQLKRMEVVQIDDTHDLEDEINQSIAQRYPGRWLLVPIPNLGDTSNPDHTTQVWGSLSLLRSPQDEPWQEWQVETACLIADQLAIAIHQGNLYAQASTEQKQTKAALQKSEELFRTLFEQAPIPISVMDLETYRIVQRNDAHRKLLGYNDEELAQTTVVENSHQDDWEADLAQVERLISGELSTFQMEKRLIHKNGSVIDTNLTVALVKDTEGRIYSLGMIEDIGERKAMEAAQRQAEKALQASEARYRAIVETQTELITRFLPDGTLTYANPAYCRYYGGQPEDFLNRSFETEIHPDDLDRVRSLQASLSLSNPVVSYEQRWIDHNGTLRWQQWTDRGIFDAEGSLIEGQGVGKDITDRKHAELQAAKSLHEKEVLLREIHHRVKNNLQMITSLLRLQASYIEDPRLVEPLRDSQSRVKAMALVHEQLYRSENLARVNFAEYIDSLVTHLQRAYALTTHQIQFRQEIASVELNADQVVPCGLIVSELISNAIKHAFPPCAFPNEAEIYIGFTKAIAGHYVLQIADNGVGLPPNFNLSSVESLGFQLITALTHQLRGKMLLDQESCFARGTCVRIEINPA
jgi:PAS domain S-box-containing protein